MRVFSPAPSRAFTPARVQSRTHSRNQRILSRIQARIAPTLARGVTKRGTGET